jgi:dihydroorotate dehydrogenase
MLYPLLRPLFFALDPERAHHLALGALALLQTLRLSSGHAFPPVKPLTDRRLAQDLWGLHFSNPIGLAAGYDKNARVPLVWSALGFGFAELGTITARPQAGNPRPRIFRLEKDRALLNRLGFNNEGAEAIAARLTHLLPPSRPHAIPLGFNLGKSRVVPLDEAVADYQLSFTRLFPFADYFVINVSSPNTPELRRLQETERLGQLLEALLAQNRLLALEKGVTPRPILVKIAPDLDPEATCEVARTAMVIGAAGLVATNTTLCRPPLRSLLGRAAINEEGGLSGQPLTKRATEVIRVLFRATEGRLPIVGVGGVFSAEDAYEKIRAGASLVQVYTGLVYEGPFLPRHMVRGLLRLLARDGFDHLSQAIGQDA